jgi:cell wall-associated NlpC family hydrolase
VYKKKRWKKPAVFGITQKYVGAPYKLGGWSRTNGFDCFSLVYITAVRDFHIQLPKEFEGITLDDYHELWEEDRVDAMSRLITFIRSVTKRVKKNFQISGDLLVLKSKTGMFIGIMAGTDSVLSSFENVGVALTRLNQYEILEARRWEMP